VAAESAAADAADGGDVDGSSGAQAADSACQERSAAGACREANGATMSGCDCGNGGNSSGRGCCNGGGGDGGCGNGSGNGSGDSDGNGDGDGGGALAPVCGVPRKDGFHHLSRGRLTTDFLLGSEQPERYASAVRRDAYHGFNLVVADIRSGEVRCSSLGIGPGPWTCEGLGEEGRSGLGLGPSLGYVNQRAGKEGGHRPVCSLGAWKQMPHVDLPHTITTRQSH